MINQEIAQVFSNMSSYFEMESGQKAFFRSRAFRKASEVVSKFPHDFSSTEWNDLTKLKKIEGIGDATARHILEFVKTGKVIDYENMKKNSPIKLEELLRIQGIGPKKILRLYKELGVKDIKTLQKAAEGGEISQLDGFGTKSEKNILESIEFAIIHKDRISIADADGLIRELLTYIKHDQNVEKAEAVGSYRRKRETVGDIDILVASNNPIAAIHHFVKFPSVEKILSQGETKASIWLKNKIQTDLRVVKKEEWGAALQYFTGSREHNIRLRNHAIKRGYKLSEYGLFDRKTKKKVESESEESIYEKLGFQFIPPELREDEGEINAAINGQLPTLVTLKDIRGDLQMHTTFSDGANTIEQMAQKGIELGYDYIGITDHFGKLKVANAVDEKEFYKYITAIRSVNSKIPDIKILAGAEVELDKTGNLEFDRKMLKQLDFVIATVHFNMNMEKELMTQRLVKAVNDSLTTFVAHPTGRLIGKRPGFEYDYEKVFQEAAKNNVAIEINAHPMRLDINNELARLCKSVRCKIVINTDAHSIKDLDYMQYGVDVARRGWIEKSDLYYPEF